MASLRVNFFRFLLRLLGVVEAATRRPRLLTGLGAALAASAALSGPCVPGRGELRMATFNIRRFGVEPTDMDHLVRLVEGFSADVIAVQEVQRVERLDELAEALRARGRPYRAVASGCAGRRQMHVGFLYDERRAKLKQLREFRELLPEEGGCSDGDRPGLLGVFEAGGREVHALVVHLKAGDSDEFARQRREQWGRLGKLIAMLKAEGAQRVVLLGDVNSTGFLENRRGEREFIERFARDAGMSLPTSTLGCTEYYADKKRMNPSLLDHALVTEGLLVPGSVAVHAHCAELRCQPQAPGTMPPSYTDVSDHCPVTFGLRFLASHEPQLTCATPPRSWHAQPLMCGARQAHEAFWAQEAAQAQAGGALPAVSQ